MARQIEINGTSYNARELGNDGYGNRLLLDIDSDKVVNEKFDPETGAHLEFNGDVEGWGYSKSDSLI